jgi:hypothetical protein
MPVKVIDESGGSRETNDAGKIEVDGKSYSIEDVQNLVKQGTAATQKTQEVAGILAAAEKYGVDIETYLGQAEGAFGVMSQLIADKVIDEKGNIIKTEPVKLTGAEPEREVDLDKLLNLSAGGEKGLAGVDKVAAIVAKALEPQLEGIKKLGERVAAVDKTQGDMIRLNLEEKVVSKFPNLKPNDVSQVFGSAMQDRSKSLWEHAEAASREKAVGVSDLRKEHAKEFGVNLEKFDENKLKEQEAGGGAGVLFKGKKFSFNAKRGDAETVSPKAAAMEFIEQESSSS